MKPGDVAWVPFPFVETNQARVRPALVVNVLEPAKDLTLLWVLMITSSANKGWEGDISLETRFAECGLKVPCVVRTAKVSTIEAKYAAKVGSLPADLMALVRTELGGMLFSEEGS